MKRGLQSLDTLHLASRHQLMAYCVQTVVIDAHGHMLGRLASIAAKQLLTGQQLVSVSLFKG